MTNAESLVSLITELRAAQTVLNRCRATEHRAATRLHSAQTLTQEAIEQVQRVTTEIHAVCALLEHEATERVAQQFTLRRQS